MVRHELLYPKSSQTAWNPSGTLVLTFWRERFPEMYLMASDATPRIRTQGTVFPK